MKDLRAVAAGPGSPPADTGRAPRGVQPPDTVPSAAGRRLLYAHALHASAQLHEPQGFVALVLLEVQPAEASMQHPGPVLATVTTRLAEMLNRRLRSVDVLVRSASCELAVLLTLANIGVAAAFSERLRQPIEQVLRDQALADEVVVCMGLAANPPANPWQPEMLIELADFRMREALRRARQNHPRDWALIVDGAAMPANWPEPAAWPATAEITNDSGF